jgi:transcriptional regulator GlxA family with amidase domain
MATGRVTLSLVDAVHRLIDLLGEEKDIPILSPLIHREILYRLLTGDQGARLRQFATRGSRSQQMAHTIEWMKQHFTEAISVDDLAQMAGMSPSSFHQHFRAMTALSPLQYQKQLRLQEARRLMLTEHLDAATAAFRVGYESPSQFSREYGRMFGAPPRRDMTHLRQIAVSE